MRKLSVLLQFSVLETSHLICNTNQLTSFQAICNYDKDIKIQLEIDYLMETNRSLSSK